MCHVVCVQTAKDARRVKHKPLGYRKLPPSSWIELLPELTDPATGRLPTGVGVFFLHPQRLSHLTADLE